MSCGWLQSHSLASKDGPENLSTCICRIYGSPGHREAILVIPLQLWHNQQEYQPPFPREDAPGHKVHLGISKHLGFNSLNYRKHCSCFILRRRSEQLATQAPAMRPWQSGEQSIRDVGCWPKILPPPLGPTEGLPGLGLIWGILVHLLSSNSFDNVYYQVNNLMSNKSIKKQRQKKRNSWHGLIWGLTSKRSAVNWKFSSHSRDQ